MAFVQRDVLLRLIEQLAEGVARALTGKKLQTLPPEQEVDDEIVARSAGLGVDIACALPATSVSALVEGDRARLTLLGLAVGRRAWATSDPALARRALDLLDAAAPLEPHIEPARLALATLAGPP